MNKRKCKYCKIGMKSFELDRLSPVCPYIECYKNGECGMFAALEKYDNNFFVSVFKKMMLFLSPIM